MIISKTTFLFKCNIQKKRFVKYVFVIVSVGNKKHFYISPYHFSSTVKMGKSAYLLWKNKLEDIQDPAYLTLKIWGEKMEHITKTSQHRKAVVYFI